MSEEKEARLDDQEDIAEEIPTAGDRAASDPTAAGRQPFDAGQVPEQAHTATPEMVPDPATGGVEATPRLYRLRPPGLRPVRRPLRRHGLRNDCPPDRRQQPRSPSSRNHLR